MVAWVYLNGKRIAILRRHGAVLNIQKQLKVGDVLAVYATSYNLQNTGVLIMHAWKGYSMSTEKQKWFGRKYTSTRSGLDRRCSKPGYNYSAWETVRTSHATGILSEKQWIKRRVLQDPPFIIWPFYRNGRSAVVQMCHTIGENW